MLINIQFLRFVAATLVVVYHASAHVRVAGGDLSGLFGLGEALGFAGVDVFFVISGFIMYHTTREREGAAQSVDFLQRRAARIYSGYWPFFVLATLTWWWIRPERLQQVDIIASATLWPGRNLMLPVSWTLTYEMIFYLLFGLLMLFRPTLRLRLFVATFIGIVAWSAWSHWGRHAYDPGQLEYISLAEAYLVSPYLAEFIAGVLAAAWLQRHPEGVAWPWMLTGSALFLAGGWINVSAFDNAIEQGYTMVWRVLVFGPAAVMMLLGLVRLERAGWVAPKRLSLGMGGASYALYLCHTPILWISAHLGMQGALQAQGATAVNLGYWALVLAILAYSLYHYRFVERPLHRWFKRLLRLERA